MQKKFLIVASAAGCYDAICS